MPYEEVCADPDRSVGIVYITKEIKEKEMYETFMCYCKPWHDAASQMEPGGNVHFHLQPEDC